MTVRQETDSDQLDAVTARLESAEQEIDQLRQALTSSRRVGAAVGILMARRGVSDTEAFALMATWGRDHARKVRDVAEDVLWVGDLPA